jgi:TIR domain
MEMEWDVSQATRVKIRAILCALSRIAWQLGLRVWFDELTLTIGDSLRQSIDRGLANSRFGIVVISPSFLQKDWPQKELDGLIAGRSTVSRSYCQFGTTSALTRFANIRRRSLGGNVASCRGRILSVKRGSSELLSGESPPLPFAHGNQIDGTTTIHEGVPEHLDLLAVFEDNRVMLAVPRSSNPAPSIGEICSPSKRLSNKHRGDCSKY